MPASKICQPLRQLVNALSRKRIRFHYSYNDLGGELIIGRFRIYHEAHRIIGGKDRFILYNGQTREQVYCLSVPHAVAEIEARNTIDLGNEDERSPGTPS